MSETTLKRGTIVLTYDSEFAGSAMAVCDQCGATASQLVKSHAQLLHLADTVTRWLCPDRGHGEFY